MKTYPKLPKAFKRKWVAALRSGKFKQCGAYLYDGEKYCCLGVAGVVANVPKKNLKGYGTLDCSEHKGVPDELFGECGETPLVDTLTEKNDSGRWSFNRIADWIEKHI